MSDSIVQMYETGKYSMAEVGREFSVSRQRVHQLLKAANVLDRDVRTKKLEYEKRMYTEAVAIVREMYRNGSNLLASAKEVGVPTYVLKRLYKRNDEDKKAHQLAKFFAKTKVGDIPDGFDKPCLVWTGAMMKDWGIHCARSTQRSARKYAWFFEHGEWVEVKSLCGDMLCVEHTHMEKK